MLRKGQKVLSVNCGRLEIHLLLNADDTVADSVEKLCRLASEFGTECKTIKLRAESECR